MRYAALALGLLAQPAFADISLEEATSGMDLVPCELSSLSCTTMTLPLDRRANDPDQTIDITFALSFATVESRGILFYFVGGPGGSGLASADSYLSGFDPYLTDYIDIVFVDQRGTGAEHGLVCPVAQARFDIVPATLDDPDAVIAAARAYVDDCIAELDADALLPVVGTDVAIQDSEAFRQAIGAPKVWLYGESYGTQFVQTYATAYPDAVAGVIVDGVVDLNLSPAGFYRSYILASEALLTETLAACADIPACKADMAGDAAQVYDDLASKLAQGPLPVPVTLGDGSQVKRQLTSGILETNAFYALYAPAGRTDFLRALAAASKGDFWPMLQLGYYNLSIDYETEVGIVDPGWSGAAYYAITCSDYGSGTGTPDERAARILDEARALAPQAPRLLRSYYLEQIACAYWPHQGSDTRPKPFVGGDWPTLVLNGDRDPITPITMAYSVLDNAKNAYGIFMQGGPHVIFGWGNACPDRIVQDLLVDGVLPSSREQICTQAAIGDYTPRTLTDPADLADPFAVASAVETELYQFLPLTNWDGLDPKTYGCPHGGTVTATATDLGTDYTFQDCRFWPELAVTGTGVEIAMDDADDGLTLTLAASGAQTGDLAYHYSTVSEAWSLSGTWNGQPANLPRGLR